MAKLSYLFIPQFNLIGNEDKISGNCQKRSRLGIRPQFWPKNYERKFFNLQSLNLFVSEYGPQYMSVSLWKQLKICEYSNAFTENHHLTDSFVKS